MAGKLDRDDRSKPMLLVDQDGIIQHANKAALELWGSPLGQSCANTVRARDSADRWICLEGCPRGARRRDARRTEVHVRDHVATLHCSVLGDSVVVALERLHRAPDSLDTLTPREREVLALVAKGHNTTDAAELLGVSRSTVRTHMQRCRAKLRASTQADAVAKAIATHQLEPG
jgi:RNA polymerase sigma factor (sigma-70 family)